MNTQDNMLMVSINCLVYNHEPYIRQCLEGFVMQKTNFRFEAIVHDDASTDGSAAIIREYAEKYPDIIKPILETENQYSKHDGSLRRIMEDACKGKYIAICEGDDYWIDPNKLQKQYDLMETHPDFSLCFHADYTLYPSGKKVLHKPKEIKSIYYPKDIILGGGGFMATNSMFYRRKYINDNSLPDYFKHCPVGDMPMMLFLVSKGSFGYINDVMSVYRYASLGSWTIRQDSFNKRWKHHCATSKMYDAYNENTGFKYQKVIRKKKFVNIIIFILYEIRLLTK